MHASTLKSLLGFRNKNNKISNRNRNRNSNRNRNRNSNSNSNSISNSNSNRMKIDDENDIRRRSRFPDPQWTCAYNNIKEQVDYMCNNEMPVSFSKYCKVLYA